MTFRRLELGAAFWFLIPERRDTRPQFGNGTPEAPGAPGAPHDAQVIVGLLQQLEVLAGGATRSLGRDRVQGVWEGIPDTSLRFEVAMSSDKREELLALLSRAAVTFGQECIYVVADREAVLVYREGTQ